MVESAGNSCAARIAAAREQIFPICQYDKTGCDPHKRAT
jgi:hypothetical protein